MLKWLFANQQPRSTPQILEYVPEIGDIVLCKFPGSDKLRPGLVVGAPLFGNAVDVAYGTSRSLHDLRSGDFVIHPDPYNGLWRPTKFCTTKTSRLPLTFEWFAVPRGKVGRSPLLGRVQGWRNKLAFWAA